MKIVGCGVALWAICGCGARPTKEVCPVWQNKVVAQDLSNTQDALHTRQPFERALLSLANCPVQLTAWQVELLPIVFHDAKCGGARKLKLSYTEICSVAQALHANEVFANTTVIMLLPDEAVNAMYHDTTLTTRARFIAKNQLPIVYVDAYGTVVVDGEESTAYFRLELDSKKMVTLRSCGRAVT